MDKRYLTRIDSVSIAHEAEGWALINFFCLQDGRLFEVGANSRLGAYSNKYGSI